MIDDSRMLSCAKGAAEPEVVDCFEEAGLAASVITMQDVESWTGLDVHVNEISELMDFKSEQLGHNYRRMGITKNTLSQSFIDSSMSIPCLLLVKTILTDSSDSVLRTSTI